METTGQRQDISGKRDFTTQVYYAILDSIIAGINRTFSGLNCGIMIQSLNSMSESFLKLETIITALAYEINLNYLQQELHIERKKQAGSDQFQYLFCCLLAS
jgi:hypothetical protein